MKYPKPSESIKLLNLEIASRMDVGWGWGEMETSVFCVCLLCPFGGGESLLNCLMYLNRSQLPVVPCQLRMNGWFSWLTITILSKWALIPPKKYRQNLNWTFIVFVGCIDVKRQERSLDFFVSTDAMLPTTSTSAKKPMDFHPNVSRSPTLKCKCHLWTTPESTR